MTGSFSQLVDSWNALWQSVGGAPLFTYVIVAVSVSAAILASMGMRRLWPVKPRGFHYDQSAAQWARPHFPEPQRRIAAYVAQLIHEQLGVDIADLEPATHFVNDLGMDDLEPLELLMAVESDLAITISEEDAERLATITGLIEYLHERVESTNQPSMTQESRR